LVRRTRVKKIAFLGALLFGTYTTDVLALVINFENLVGNAYFDEPQISGGFVFDDVNSNSFGHGTTGIDGFSTNNGTQMLWDWSNSGVDPTITRMVRQGGGTFDLSAFDFVSGYSDGTERSATLTVEGFYLGGSLGATVFNVDVDFSHAVISTLNVNIAGADEVRFTGSGGATPRNAFDNFVWSESEAVPEPSALGLLVLGLAGVGAVRRKLS
jgi:hypothetical protein